MKTTRTSRLIGWAAAAVILAVAAWWGRRFEVKDAQANTIEHSPGPAPELSELARSTLHSRMKAHGEQMQQLSVAAVLLRYPDIQRLANRVANEPALSRPEKGSAGDVNAELPEQLFILQDNLRRNAKALSSAAAKEDDPAIARSFGDLSTSCISCHSAFLPKR